MNWQTFSQVAFGFAVTPNLLVQGLIYALHHGTSRRHLPRDPRGETADFEGARELVRRRVRRSQVRQSAELRCAQSFVPVVTCRTISVMRSTLLALTIAGALAVVHAQPEPDDRPPDSRRRRGREVLVAMARTVGTGTRRRHELHRHLVGHRSRQVARAGAGTRPFVTHRLGDHIFLTTATDDGATVSMLAFRRSDGARLWQTVVPSSGVEHVYRKNSRASATPTTDGERVYASFGTHGLAAFDFSGKIVWHRKLGDLAQLSRQRRLAGPLQGPDLPLSGSRRIADAAIVRRGVRREDREDDLVEGPRRDRRLGHADRDPGRRSRRAHRQQPAPHPRLQSRRPATSCGPCAATRSK